MVNYAFRDVNVMSGEIRAYISGDAVSISGQPVTISGQQIDFVSGIVVELSGLNVVANLGGINISLASGTQITIQSGIGVVTSVSGQVVQISGQQVEISGQAVYVSGVVDILSGAYINIGSGIGVTVQSGINIFRPPPTVIRARSPLMVPDSSGGVILSSGETREITLRALDGDIYIGSPIGNDMPYSGCGVLIMQGDTVAIPINNFNAVSVFASVSGNRVSFGGVY